MKWIGLVAGVLVLAVAAMAVIGALLPRDHAASRTATFKRPAAEIFALISDLQLGPQWRTGLKAVELQSALATGTVRYVETSSMGVVAMELLERVPDRRMVTRIADDSLPYGGGWTFELEPVNDGGGTRLTITERGEVKNVIFRFMSRFVFGHTATLDQYLRDVGRRFGEETVPSAASPPSPGKV